MAAPMFLASATSFRVFRDYALVCRRAGIRSVEILTTVQLAGQLRLMTSIKATQGNTTPIPLVDKPLPSAPTLPPPPSALPIPLALPPPPILLALPPPPSAPPIPLAPPSALPIPLAPLTSSTPSAPSPSSPNVKVPIIQNVIEELYHTNKQASMNFSSLVSNVYQRLRTEGYVIKKNKALTAEYVSKITKHLIVTSNIPGIPKADRKVLCSTVQMTRKEAAKAAKLGLISTKTTNLKHTASAEKPVEKSMPSQLTDKEPMDNKEAKPHESLGATKADKVDNLKGPIAKIKALDNDSYLSWEEYSLGPQSQELYAATVRMVLWQSCYDFLCKHQEVIDDKVRERIVERCLQSGRFARANLRDWASFDLRAMLLTFSEFSDCFVIKKDGKNKSLLFASGKPLKSARLFSKMRALINLDSHDNHSDPRGRYPDRQMDALIGTASNCLAMLGMDNKLLKSLSYEFNAIKVLGKPPVEKAPFTFEPDSVRETLFNEVSPSTTVSEAHEKPIATKPATTEEPVIEMTFNYIDSLVDLAEATNGSKSPNLTVQEWAELKMAMMRSEEVMQMATQICGAARKQTDSKQMTWFVRNAKLLLRASEEMPTRVSQKYSSRWKFWSSKNWIR